LRIKALHKTKKLITIKTNKKGKLIKDKESKKDTAREYLLIEAIY
jgi:hypothetical protein